MPSAISAQMHCRYPIGHLSNSLRYNFRSDLVPGWQNERRAAIAVQFDLTLFVHLAKKLPKVGIILVASPILQFCGRDFARRCAEQQQNLLSQTHLGIEHAPHTVADPKQWHSPLG